MSETLQSLKKRCVELIELWQDHASESRRFAKLRRSQSRYADALLHEARADRMSECAEQLLALLSNGD